LYCYYKEQERNQKENLIKERDVKIAELKEKDNKLSELNSKLLENGANLTRLKEQQVNRIKKSNN
jgi:hypothetical protein